MTTMIVEPPRRMTMGVGFEANRGRVGDPQAWKKAIGSRPVPARLALLPEPQRRWDRIGVSAIGQVGFFGFVLLLPLIFPEQMKTALNLRPTELMQPVTLIPVAPPPPPAEVKPKPLPKPRPVAPEPVKLNPRQTHVFLTAKAVQPEMKKVEVKPVELNPQLDPVKLDMQTKEPKRPKDDVKVGLMSTGSAAAERRALLRPGFAVARAGSVRRIRRSGVARARTSGGAPSSERCPSAMRRGANPPSAHRAAIDARRAPDNRREGMRIHTRA